MMLPVNMQAAWDGYDRGAREAGGSAPPQDFASWLPDFFEVILAAAASELRWCASVLPELHPQLVLHLLATLFNKIGKSFRSRLMSACAAGVHLLPTYFMLLCGLVCFSAARLASLMSML